MEEEYNFRGKKGVRGEYMIRIKYTFILTALILLICSASCANSQDVTINNADKSLENVTEQPYLFLIRMQKKEHVNLMQSSMWTLTHDYKDKENVDIVLSSFTEFMKSIEKYGKDKSNQDELKKEYNKFKNKMLAWLEYDDQAVRAFAATLIGISGDKTLSKKLLNLLNGRMLNENELVIYDRRQAAIAMGLLDAKEYSSELVKLLSSPNDQDRIGGLYGLGFLKAKNHISDIEKLLKDTDEDVREAAEESLNMINAEK